MERGQNSEEDKKLAHSNGGILKKNKRDHISDLPDDVLLTIISSSSLSMSDAVRVRCLSSRWKHLYASYGSHLCFNWNLMFSTPPFTRNSTRLEYFCRYCYFYPKVSKSNYDPKDVPKMTDKIKADKERFVDGVSKILEMYKGCHHVIESFTVDFCLEDEYTSHIDEWVNFAIEKGVKKLVLKLSCSRCPTIRINDNISLEYLQLQDCKLPQNMSSQFSSLTSLRLTRVLLNQERLHAFSRSCLKLKSLAFEECILFVKPHIFNEFLCLETLALHRCDEIRGIELEAANLTTFSYSGNLYALSFSRLRLPNLRRVYLKLRGKRRHEIGFNFIFTQLAENLPDAAKFLAIDVERAPSVPSALAATFKVKQLILSFRRRMMNFNMLKVIDILRAFPILQKLELQAWCPQNINIYEADDAGEYQVQHLGHLEEVEIRGFHESQIDFAIYLLKFAISLKRLILKPQIQISSPEGLNRVSWDEGERQKISQALQHFTSDKEVIIAP